jgi:hypothetical protein
MSNSSGCGSDNRIQALRKKEAALKATIALELVRQQKRKEKDDARLFSIIGQALVQNAAKHPDFELMLKSVLQTATSLGDSEKKLLRTKGWL